MADDTTPRDDQPTEADLVDFADRLAATEGQLQPDPEPGELSVAHADYLAASAVDPELARWLGVRTISGPADLAELGEDWERYRNFPAILFPWTSPDGRVEYQARPDTPTQDARGRPRKYLFRRGMVPVLWQVRRWADSVQRPVLIVEGTKQALAAASWLPPGDVYAIAGCRSWQHEGVPIPDLAVADGREVVVVLDADAAGNPEVYDAGAGLAAALAAEGATSVKFARLPAAGKSGLDDVLAARPAERRAEYLRRVIEGAKPKPADKRPRRKSRGTGEEDGRPVIDVAADRRDVIEQLVQALVDKWDRSRLFCHGGVISRLEEGWSIGPARMHPVTRGTFNQLIVEAAMPVTTASDGSYQHAWPDANTMSAVLSSGARFTPLDRVVTVPFIRPDGTVCAKAGYDEATRTLLSPSADLGEVAVPEQPTEQQVAAARDLILQEWLGDMPLDGPSRANVLALVLTPFVRGMVPLVPLAVVDGLQMSVGKNLLADCLAILVTGRAADVLPYSPDDVEQRKVITSTFRSGAGLFVFDEAHEIGGASLARAITALTYSDRVLGVSEMAEFPNRVTWVSLGNNVTVRGDMTRRVYRIRLAPAGAHPENRPLSMYRHPDLRGWTAEHRAELVAAALTLVRAWFVAGRPVMTGEAWLGSFEAWQRTVGGVLQLAGVEGFLDNVREWRSETDFWGQYRAAHLEWLREQFGTDHPFTASQVRARAMADPAGYQAPDDLDDPGPKDYAKVLGMHYAKISGREYEGLVILKIPRGNTKVSARWVVREVGEGSPGRGEDVPPDPDSDRDQQGPTGTPQPLRVGNASLRAGARTRDTRGEESETPSLPLQVPTAEAVPGLVVFDLETGDVDDLYRYPDPRAYVRLAGMALDSDAPIVANDVSLTPGRTVAQWVRQGEPAVGHNIMAFDLPALVRAGWLEMADLHRLAAAGRVLDTLLVARHLDPPMAKDKGVDAQRRLDLDSLGERLGLGGKAAKLADLAKRHGGYDQIPLDDPQYREYLVRDVELNRAVYRDLVAALDAMTDQDRAYVRREHRVAAIAAQISHNGFLVDQPELARRVTAIEERKQTALELLHGKYGIPLNDEKGRPYDSPLSTKLGKRFLAGAFTAAGVSSYWTTDKTGEIQLSAEHMRHLAREYHHLPDVREIARAVYQVVGARTVYETASTYLCPDGRVHPKIGFEQSTGRWSVTRPGLTVFGKRGGRHVEREIFLPDPGELVLTADLSQVDMRGVAGSSQDAAYIRMLETEDPHAEIARLLFGTVDRREQAKAIGHGWNYGRGIRAIAETEEIEPRLVVQFDASMRERFPRLVAWQGEVRAIAESGQLLNNGFGRPMRADPRRAHTQGPALMGQGAARDIMMEGLLRLADAHPEVLPMLRAQIHDEVVLSVPADQVADVRRAVLDAFTWEWRGVPIVAESGPAGANWGAVYEKGA